MSNKKIKAEVRINDPDFVADIVLALSDPQAADVLEAVISGEPLKVSLVTGLEDQGIRENPAAYAQ